MEVVEYNITDAKIAEMSDKYMVLKLTDVNDKDGFNKLSECRKDVKAKRNDVERTRKILKAGSIAYGKKVDSEAHRITQLLLPIERHLIEQGDVIKNEKERIKNEKLAKIEEIFRKRILLIVDSGAVFNGSHYVYGEHIINDDDLRTDSDDSFSLKVESLVLWKKAQDLEQAEIERVKKEEAKMQAAIAEAQKIEREKLDKIAAEQAEQAKKLKAAQDKIDEDNRKQEEQVRIDEAREAAQLEAERNAEEQRVAHKLELEQAEKKAKEDAKIAAEKAVEAEKEGIRQVKEAEEKRLRLLPEKEKLLALAEKFINPTLPILESQEGIAVIEVVRTELNLIGESLKTSIEKL